MDYGSLLLEYSLQEKQSLASPIESFRQIRESAGRTQLCEYEDQHRSFDLVAPQETAASSLQGAKQSSCR